MADSPAYVGRVPARLDRYPGKMVGHLAHKLVEKYAQGADHLVDPFCGSGAILRAGVISGVRVSGVDINPFGVLLSRVKIQGFDSREAKGLWEKMVRVSRAGEAFPIRWGNKGYWFSGATVGTYERLRAAAKKLELYGSNAGQAVLLALGLSARLCSRADQRSPKPFISREARAERLYNYYDPESIIRGLLLELTKLYGGAGAVDSRVYQFSMVDPPLVANELLWCSHVITSPPYVNAQDYFRSSKLELFLLEGLLPFRVRDIVHRFVGTERGVDRGVLEDCGAPRRRELLPLLRDVEQRSPGRAAILHRYLDDMEKSFRGIRELLRPGGTLVLACGDNLIAGVRIGTWGVLCRMLETLGFVAFDRFEDRIRNRALAPRRKGHRGLITEEVIMAFRLGIWERSG